MSEADRIIEDAARLPLLDAAFELWIKKRRLDQFERPAPRAGSARIDVKDPRALAASVQAALATARDERANAQEGPTFDRLKRAHPQASHQDARRAILAAVKLDRDCARHFKPGGANFIDDVTRAVELARAENQGFQEPTYKSARDHLAYLMK